MIVLALLAALITPVTLAAKATASPTLDLGAGCTARATVAARTVVRTTKVGRVERTYRIHVPRGYSGRRAYPLIVAFHGHAETAVALQRYSGLTRLPAIVVFADGLRGTDGQTSWQGAPYSSRASDDVAFTRTILREMRASACIDRNRTYAVGRSNGGGLVALLSCRLPHDFAAFAVVNGALYAQSWQGCAGAPPASIIEFHGTADPVMRYGGGARHGGRYVGVQEALSRWAARDLCVPASVITRVDRFATRYEWSWCAAPGKQVVHYRITGGGHMWPGANARTHARPSDAVSATNLIWQFFGRHVGTTGAGVK